MKSALLLVFSMISLLSSAQTIIISDNFDSLTAGTPVAASSPLWITWSGASTEDAIVDTTQASSEPNSIYIIGNNGPTDIMLPFPSNYTSGVYELTMKMFIVTGKGAYFNLQGSNIAGVDWMLEVYFDNAGGGSVNAGGIGAATASYIPNAWNDIKVNVDLTNDQAQIFFNNTLTHTWQWSLGSDGLGAAQMWGGLNIYASAVSPPGDAEFYVDDVVLTDLTVTGIEDVSSVSGISVFPNPSRGNFEVSCFSKYNANAKLQLFNVSGEKVMESEQKLSVGKNIYKNESLMPVGIYFLRLITDDNAITQKFVVAY